MGSQDIYFDINIEIKRKISLSRLLSLAVNGPLEAI